MDRAVPASRYIELEGCSNLRDIGGYHTIDGRVTLWGKVFRADGLHRLPVASQEKLLSYAIQTIIDLRHAEEVKGAPNVFAQTSQVVYQNISLIEEHTENWGTVNLWEINKRMIDRQSGLKQVFESLTDTVEFPVIIHCTGGKDRTGLVIALLLSMLNVPRETIVEDYALSAIYLKPFFEQIRQQVEATGIDLSQFEQLLVSPPELMLEILVYIDENYGGVKAYLKRLGLTEQQMKDLRERLTEEVL